MIRRIAQRANMNQKDILPILEVIEDETLYAISMEEEMPFKFGKIGGKTVPARNGVNPKTGEKKKVVTHTGPRGGKFYYPDGKPKKPENKVYVESESLKDYLIKSID